MIMSVWNLPLAGLTSIGVLAGCVCGQIVPGRDGIINDPSVVAYVQRVKNRLTGNSGGRTLEIRITRGTEMYVSLLPSDVLYISGALFERAESEAELAGLLAHELAHRPKPPCVLASARFRSTGSEDPRESELQATEVALKTMRLAGYDPSAVLDFFSKLA